MGAATGEFWRIEWSEGDVEEPSARDGVFGDLGAGKRAGVG